MKNLRIKFLALLLVTSVAFLSCKKEDRLSPIINDSNNTENRTENRPIIIQSEWKISLFKVNDRNETREFSKYLFVFAEKGMLNVTADKRVPNGTWAMGGKSNPNNFIIMFATLPLSRLSNNQWIIVNKTSQELRLEYISRKGGHAYLTFQKVEIQTEYNPLD